MHEPFDTLKLTQQYIVDGYARNESQRLRYLKSGDGQKRIRADMYSGIMDAVNNNMDASSVGKGGTYKIFI